MSTSKKLSLTPSFCLLFACFFWVGISNALAQSNCTTTIGVVDQAYTNSSVYVATTGSNDLADNPLVAVSLDFFHSYAADLLLVLESPAGKRYILVGDQYNEPFSGCSGAGGGDIDFDGRIVPGFGNPADMTFLQGQVTGDYNGLTILSNSNEINNRILQATILPNGDLNDFNVPGDPVAGKWRLLTGCVCMVSDEYFEVTSFSLHFEDDSVISCDHIPSSFYLGDINFDQDSLIRCVDIESFIVDVDDYSLPPNSESYIDAELWKFYVKDGLIKIISRGQDGLTNADGTFELYTFMFDRGKMLSNEYDQLRQGLNRLYNDSIASVEGVFQWHQTYFRASSVPRHAELPPLELQRVSRIFRSNDTLELLNGWTMTADEYINVGSPIFINYYLPVPGECDASYVGVLGWADLHLDTSFVAQIADTVWFYDQAYEDVQFLHQEGDTSAIVIVPGTDSVGFVTSSAGLYTVRLEAKVKSTTNGSINNWVLEFDFTVLQPFAPTDPDGNGRVDWRDVLFTAWHLGASGNARATVSSGVNATASVLPWLISSPISGLNAAYVDVDGDGVVSALDLVATSETVGATTTSSNLSLNPLPSATPSSTLFHWTEETHAHADSVRYRLSLIDDPEIESKVGAIALVGATGFEVASSSALTIVASAHADSTFIVFSKTNTGIGGSYDLGSIVLDKLSVLNGASQLLVGTTPLLVLTAEENPLEVGVSVDVLVSTTESVNNNLGISIYPNPSSGELLLAWADAAQRIHVSDIQGRLILEIDINKQDRSRSIELPIGTYMVSISGENGMLYTERVIVK